VLGRELRSERDRQTEARRYAVLVEEAQAADATFWQDNVQGQI
jgi:hypothetical protein